MGRAFNEPQQSSKLSTRPLFMFYAHTHNSSLLFIFFASTEIYDHFSSWKFVNFWPRSAILSLLLCRAFSFKVEQIKYSMYIKTLEKCIEFDVVPTSRTSEFWAGFDTRQEENFDLVFWNSLWWPTIFANTSNIKDLENSWLFMHVLLCTMWLSPLILIVCSVQFESAKIYSDGVDQRSLWNKSPKETSVPSVFSVAVFLLGFGGTAFDFHLHKRIHYFRTINFSNNYDDLESSIAYLQLWNSEPILSPSE